MNFIYTTTPKDYLSLLNRILNHSVFGKNFSKYAWIAISVLAWMSVVLPFIKFQEFGIGFWTRVIFALLVTICWPYFYDKYTDGIFSGIINDKTLVRYVGKVSITISEEFIESITQTTTSKENWNDVHSIEINDTHIFIFFTPIIATPIPMTAFRNIIEQNELIQEIERHISVTNARTSSTSE